MENKQESNVNIDLFESLRPNEEEQNFIKSIVSIDSSSERNNIFLQRKTALSILYLAKQIELSSRSSDKNANKMFWLTLVIGIFGLVELVDLILKLLNVL